MSDLLNRYARPREGWLSLALLFVMLLSVSWSVQRADWIDRSESLVPIAFYAVLLGALLGLSRLSVVAVLPLSAIVGTGLTLWAVGGEYFPELSQIGRQLALRDEVVGWIRILVERGYGPQLVPWAIAFSLVMWATAFIAAYTIYRHHRVIDAILLVGAALIANLSATLAEVFIYLVLFVLAALLLWLRAALIGREESWQRRRVNENAEVPAAVMRSGVLVIVGSIALAWVLTTVAVAAPLTAVWNNLDGVWTDARERLDGLFGGLANPQARISGATFGPGFTISGQWASSDAPVLTVASSRSYYLRTATYEDYTGSGFARSSASERRVAAGSLLFPDGSPEEPLRIEAFERETVNVQYEKSLGGVMFTPGFPVKVLAPSVVLETDGQPFLGGLESPNSISPGESYFVTALISRATRAQLNSAGTNYPPEIVEHYLDIEGATADTAALAQQIVEQAGAQTPYEMAQALADFLRTDDRFSYSASAPVPTDSTDFVHFFLFDQNGQIGYCQYYATALAVMARTLGLPSRVATGFAPGQLIGTDPANEVNFYEVREENAHAWAEIYFPGYGWQAFESTKTIAPITRLTGSPIGPVPSGGSLLNPLDRLDPDDDGNISALPSSEPVAEGFVPGQSGPQPETRGGNLLVIAAIVIVAVGLAAWRLRVSRRRLRFLAPGERQWFRLALAADRAGIAQRPHETIYEYAGWLEEQIPRHRPEIRTIASGKVWQSYSGRGVSGEALARIERAWKSLELPLVWLALKRRLRALLPGRLRDR